MNGTAFMNRKRLLVVGILVVLALFLEIVTIAHFPEPLPLLYLLEFSFSSLSAVLFLGIGTLAWLYARDRLVAYLFFGFCTAMMVTFIVETGAVSHEGLFTLLGHLSSALAVMLFDLLLLLFPVNLFSVSSPRVRWRVLLRLYARGIIMYGGYSAVLSLAPQSSLPQWYTWGSNGFYAFGLSGALITLISSHRALDGTQQRQQWDVLVMGCVLAIVPFLLCTVLPSVFSIPWLQINSQISTVPLVLIAVALGYALLRYQFVLYDGTVRRITSWIIGCLGLGGVVYATLLIAYNVRPGIQLVFIPLVLAVVCPPVWWYSARLAGWVFRTDFFTPEQLASIHRSFIERRVEIDEIALFLSIATSTALETLEVCVFLFEKDDRCYRPRPARPMSGPHAKARHSLLEILADAEVLPSSAKPWIANAHPIVAKLTTTERPLLLFEVTQGKQWFPVLKAHHASSQVIFVPLRVGKELLGVLVVGGQKDDKVYAGPAFEELEKIIYNYKPYLRMRLLEEGMRHATESYRATWSREDDVPTPLPVGAMRLDERDVRREHANTIFQGGVQPALHAVQDTLALLSSENVTPERETHLSRRAAIASHTMLLMVENSLETMAIREKHTAHPLSAFALAPIVEHVLEMLEGVFKQEERSVQRTIPASISVLGEPVALRQVLINVLRTAVISSPMGTDITLLCHLVGEEIMLSVIFEWSNTLVELLPETIHQEKHVSETQLLLLVCRRLLDSMQGHFWIAQGDGSKCLVAIVLPQSRGTDV